MSKSHLIITTDQTLYDQRVKSVDQSGLVAEGEGIFKGPIQIYTKAGRTVPFYDLIKANDFEEEFGFVIRAAPQEVFMH